MHSKMLSYHRLVMELCRLKVDNINVSFCGEGILQTLTRFGWCVFSTTFIITDMACIGQTALNGSFCMWKINFPYVENNHFNAFQVRAWLIILFPLQRRKMGSFLPQLWLICVWRTDVLTSEILKWGHHLNVLNSVWHSSTSTASGGVSGASHKMMSYYESQALKLCFAFFPPMVPLWSHPAEEWIPFHL